MNKATSRAGRVLGLIVCLAGMGGLSWAQAENPPAANLIQNGGFEAKALAPWSVFGDAGKRPEVSLVAEGAFAGKQAVRLVNKAAGFGGIVATVEGVAGKDTPLWISLSAKRATASSAHAAYTFGISFNVRYQDGSAKWDSTSAGWLDPSVKEWQTRAFVWTPAKPIATLQVRVMFTDPGECLFDDITVRPATAEEIAAAKAHGEAGPGASHRVATGEAVKMIEAFNGDKLPEFLIPHIGEWQVKDGTLRTAGKMPGAGWYVRSRYQYRLDEVSFRVRKDSPGGILYLHTRHWKFMLRPQEMMVKDAQAPHWWLSCARPISFNDTNWHTLGLAFRSDRLTMTWDGAKLADWTAPADEYKGQLYGHWLTGLTLSFQEPDEIFVLHPYQTGAQFDDLAIRGIQTGPAVGFITTAFRYPSGRFIKDNAFERLAPRDPVDVNWALPEKERLAEKLPAVESFRIASPYGPRGEARGKQAVDFRVGVDPSTDFPGALMLFRKFHVPERVRLHLNLAHEGVYTLKVPLGSIRNLQQIFEVAVDGKVVSREVYQGLNTGSVIGEEGVLDYVPLKLAAGYHRIELALSPELADKFAGGLFWKALTLGINGSQGVELVPGRVLPEWTLSAKKPQPAVADDCQPYETEWFSKEIRARITDLTDGDCTVRLGFYEVLLDSPGERLMDIWINGQTVAENFDIVKEAGSDVTYITRDFPATVKNGELFLELIGKNFQASVNWIEILRGGQTLFRHHAGWAPRYRNWGYYARYSARDNTDESKIYADPAKNPHASKDYEGHNLIANPSFALAEADAADPRPQIWRAATQLPSEKNAGKPNPAFQNSTVDYKVSELAGTGEYARDASIFRSAPASLRVGRTQGELGIVSRFTYVDYLKRQKLTAWVKSDGAQGKARLAVYWFAFDYYDQQIRGVQHRLLGKSVSEQVVTGTQDWTEITVTAKPPFGAIVAAAALIVEDNAAGTFWFDDVALDGYGAEPIEITASHLGLHPLGNKRFLVKTLTDGVVAYTITDGAGKAVAAGKAAPMGLCHFPDRYFHEIDASALTREGSYTIEARQGASVARTAFKVDSGIYAQLTELLLQGLSVQRMNCEVPGWHGPTHLDDYISWQLVFPRMIDPAFKCTGQTRNELGGFYDAGDVIRHWDLVSAIALGTMLSGDCAALDSKGTAQGRQLLLWALDSLAGAQVDDGTFFYAPKPYGYDDIPKYGIERYDRARRANPQAAGIFARAALQLKDADPVRSARYKAVAERIYRSTERSWTTLSFGNESVPFNQLLITPKRIFAELYLGKLTGEAMYRERLDANVTKLCELIEKRVYLEPGFRRCRETTMYSEGAPINFDFLWAPTFLLREMPDHPQAERLKKALLVFVGDIEHLSSIEPWRQAMCLEVDGVEPARFPSPQPISYWTMLGCGLARVGMLLDRPDIVLLGERQLQWALGNNPYDICTVNGVGDHCAGVGLMMYREPEYYLAHLPQKGKLVGAPGSVSKTAFRNWPGTSMHPTGFAYMPLATDYAEDPGAMERWQMMEGNFASGAAAMSEAMQWLRQRQVRQPR